MITTLLLAIGAYALGSVASAVIVCRALGLTDPREVGSGNPGATNVLRIGGKKAAAITLLGDTGKGIIPVLIGHALGLAPPALTLVGVAAFLGHLFPVFYGFRGGKGVATLIGVNLALSPWLGLAFVGTWLAVAAVTRYSSLSALVATALTPVFAWALGQPPAAVALFSVMTVLVFWRHRPNIANLVGGREKKIGQKA
ncbi:MAG: glycerol-3-phosphate 1-O-acyltransferase PlsY [Gammaproteobacteria bacterium]|nr:glycerol-3-phosphate 1-O-acyltransferase PlsY [Gammaproteobacteria bacterium]